MISSLWYPYAQHKTMTLPYEVIHAQGVRLKLKDPHITCVDAVSSWWSVIHGYNHPVLNEALSMQLRSFSHVMLGGLTHKPAQDLANTLVSITPNGLNHVFFSDSGSVGVEVALKMALQFWKNKGQAQKSTFISLQNAYHGDTFGAMSVCDPQDSMHHLFSDYVKKNKIITSPAFNIEKSLEELTTLLRTESHAIAGLIVEPLLQGAGGLYFYPPLFLSEAKKLCEQYQVLFICDEIATGFGRTGTLFACEQAAICPDIMILGKALTAGYIGHAATLATTPVFDAFYDDDPEKALMHGPTFMGNALACAVANASISLFFEEDYLQKIAKIEHILKEELLAFSHLSVKETRVLGGVGVIEVKDRQTLAGLSRFAVDHGVWIRPFGHVVYVMPPYIIEEADLRHICTVIKNGIVR
jgi:adenosylmethionine-8-amino-7-oxononanoate aminotransferase